MSFLQKFDFNHKTGIFSVIFISIATSLLFFSLAYMFEGLGWLSAYEDEEIDLYLDVGWNWIRGSGAAFVVALILLVISFVLLKKNRGQAQRKSPLFGKLDLNGKKGLLGLVLISVSAAFFFSGILYRIESANWLYSGIAQGKTWFLEEASAWATSAYVMIMIGIFLSAAGWILIAVQWKKKTKLLNSQGSEKKPEA